MIAEEATDGNQFYFEDEKWKYTTNLSATGTYEISMESGNLSEYEIDPTCVGYLVIDQAGPKNK